jgi:hypothetical protein
MKILAAFALFLEREAGYHVVSLALIAAGIVLVDPSQRPQIAHDLVIFGTGVLARSMGSKSHPPDPATPAA